MRHRTVQREFEVSPRIVLNGLRAAGIEEDLSTLCRLLRQADVTLDEVAREIDFEDVYAAAYEEDDLDGAEQAAAGEIGRQIHDWLEERLAPVIEMATEFHLPC